MTVHGYTRLLFISGLLAASSCFANTCEPDRIDEQAVLTYVHDGDTVITDAQRKIRIIGLDTPELANKHSPAEPFATQARDVLRQLLKDSNTVGLRYDLQQKDRYQRDLAHLFLANGDNVAEQLLKKGLATALIIPPNLLFADCYLAAQKEAQNKRRGIWQLPEFQPVPLATIDTAKLPVYRLVTATVTGIQRSQRNYQIRLQDQQQQLTLFIRGSDRSLFSRMFNHGLVGQKVQVQGWINKRHGRLQLSLRHPGFLQQLADHS